MKFSEIYPVNASNKCYRGNQFVDEIKKYDKNIKLIHISSDGVYPSTKGNYSESKIGPYNLYCWSKYLSEIPVRTLKNFIIRTRFYNKKKIKFKKWLKIYLLHR